MPTEDELRAVRAGNQPVKPFDPVADARATLRQQLARSGAQPMLNVPRADLTLVLDRMDRVDTVVAEFEALQRKTRREMFDRFGEWFKLADDGDIEDLKANLKVAREQIYGTPRR